MYFVGTYPKSNFRMSSLFHSKDHSLAAPCATQQTLSKEITIIIVDDHALIRENWSYIFKIDDRFAVIGEACDGEAAIEMVRRLQPDVVLMDINLPGMNGMDATKAILRERPNTRIIGVSMHCHPAFAQGMLDSGAKGYITKTSSREELVQAVMDAMAGSEYLCAEVKNYRP